jgi:uridylate kinase
LEIEAEVLVKATKVDGVYDSDPKKNPAAKRYKKLSYRTAIEDRLKVMDQTAFTMSEEHKLPLIVLDFHKPGSLFDALTGGTAGTLVGEEQS